MLTPARATALFPRRAPDLYIPERTDASAGDHLLFLGAPFYVARFIIPIVINTIKLVFRTRATTNGSKKVGEEDFIVFIPCQIYRDAATTIVLPIFSVGIRTSLSHVAPCLPFWCFVGFIVSASSLRGGFITKAPTRARAAMSYIAACCGGFLSTIANEFPQLLFGKISESGQSSKTLTGDIDKFWHPSGYHGITAMYIT